MVRISFYVPESQAEDWKDWLQAENRAIEGLLRVWFTDYPDFPRWTTATGTPNAAARRVLSDIMGHLDGGPGRRIEIQDLCEVSPSSQVKP